MLPNAIRRKDELFVTETIQNVGMFGGRVGEGRSPQFGVAAEVEEVPR